MSAEMFQENWTEFQWEDAFRQDARRVAAYMRDLPRFLDLPDEEKIVLDHLRKVRKLDIPEEPWLENAAPDDEDDESEDDPNAEAQSYTEWMSLDGAPQLQTLGNLARAFSRLYALEIRPENRQAALAVLCEYGRVMACFADIAEEPPDEYPALRTALAKRARLYMSGLIDLMRKLSALQPNLSNVVEDHASVLRELCEKTTVLIYKFREDVQKKGLF